jgi:hypothetical protein
MFDKLVKLLKIKFEGELKLKDGNPLILDGDFEVGCSVMFQSRDGKLMDLPDGNYELYSGAIITVKDGLITDIIEELINKPNDDDGANMPVGHGTQENKPPSLEESYEIDSELTPVETDVDEPITGKTDKKEQYAMSPEELLKMIEELAAKVASLEEKIASTEAPETEEVPVIEESKVDETKLAIEKMQKDIETIMTKANFSKEVQKIETESVSKDSRLEILKQYRRK